MPRGDVAMISSTARDLPAHREQVRLACLRAGFQPREMMENLPAMDADAIAASLRMVEEADVYLGILAYRYGYVPEGHDISITEMEYNRAVELNKPRLIFLIDDTHPVIKKDVETGSGAEKLEALKKRIGKERVVAFFKSPEDLRGSVVEALIKYAGGSASRAATELHRRSSIPEAPAPYIAHPYTLMQMRDLVGRHAELSAMTDWVVNPASKAFDASIFCFVAIGGMGKSAITWKWFNQIAPEEMKPLSGRLWWSFYESDSSFENFMIRALCYVCRLSEEEAWRLPWTEREALLLHHLNAKCFLLALDGLERILIGYNRTGTENLYQNNYDAETRSRTTDNAGSALLSGQSDNDHYLRKTIDPRAGTFLRKLAQVKASRILISSRLYPADLELPNGSPRPGCFFHNLRGLCDDDALCLWRALDVSGSRAELTPIFRSVENHPLLIQVLASTVANYRKAPRDFSTWRADNPRFIPASLPLVQSRSHILEFALAGLSQASRDTLYTLAGFRMPVSYATLEALLVGSTKSCRAAQELDRALTELEDQGLIGWDREVNRYDAHPIVRGTVWRIMGVDDQHAVYTAIEAHLEPIATPDRASVGSLTDLAPAIERFHTLVGLGRYDDAFMLYRDRLESPTSYRLLVAQERITWLERLFPDGMACLPALNNECEQSYALTTLAASYAEIGQLSSALPLLRQALRIAESQPDTVNLTRTLGNLGIVLLNMGAIREASEMLVRALAFEQQSKRRFHEGICCLRLGHLICTTGDHITASTLLRRSRRLFIDHGHRIHGQRQWEVITIISLANLWLDLGDAATAGAWGERAWQLAADEKNEINFIEAALTQGRAALALNDLTCAEEKLFYALTRARASNHVITELPTLVAIAQLEFRQGQLSNARSRLDEVMAAVGGHWHLLQADVYNVLADISLAEGHAGPALAAATKAYFAAWCDGPPFAYHWALNRSRAHLVALGAPMPQVPFFDEAKFNPLPKVDWNPKDEYWIDPDLQTYLPLS